MPGLSVSVSLASVRGGGDEPAPAAPEIVAVSTWQAAPRVGEPLEFSQATVTGFPAPTVTYAIYNGDPATTGVLRLAATTYALASAWEPEAADEGDALYIVVAASNGETPDAEATSAASAAVLPAFAVPSVTASDSLATRTLTITVDTLTGEPTPDTELTTLTLDGVDVLANAIGTGPWSYVVPDSASSQTVAWTVTASNGVNPDATASGSEVVAANLSAPVTTLTSTPGSLSDGDAIAAADVTYTIDTAAVPDDAVYTRGITVDGGAFQSLEGGNITVSEGEVIRHVLTIVHAATSTNETLTSSPSTVAAADTTDPIIATFTVSQASSSDDILFTIDMTDTGETQNYASIVGVPNGEAAPSAAQVLAGNANDGTAAEFFIQRYNFTGDVTNQSVSFDVSTTVSAQSYDWYCVVEDADDNASNIASDTAVTVTNPPATAAGTLALDGGSASTTTNEAFDGGSASSTTNEVLDFAA